MNACVEKPIFSVLPCKKMSDAIADFEDEVLKACRPIHL